MIVKLVTKELNWTGIAGEGPRAMRTRTLSQSSYSDPNETSVLIYQQSSPLQPPYWTPAPTPGESAASSVANTPVMQRKRRDSKVLACINETFECILLRSIYKS